MYPDKSCPLNGCIKEDSLTHILNCKVIKANVDIKLINFQVNYEDVFAPDLRKQKEVTAVFAELLEIRDNILNSAPAASLPAPCTDFQSC